MKKFRIAQKILLFNDKDEVLVVRFAKISRIPKQFHGKWDFPGGGLYWDESLEEGLKREVEEEIGKVRFETGKSLLVWDWIQQIDSDVRTVCLLYEGKFLGGKIVLNEEHDAYRWAKIEQLRSKEFDWDKHDQTEVIEKLQELYENRETE